MLNPKEQAALDLLVNNPEYSDYFFGKVKNAKFFLILLEKGFFSELKALSPINADKEGYFSVPQWNILPYLENIAQTEGVQYKNELLQIILAVTKRRDEILKKDPTSLELDNYRTWFSFAKILACLPKETVSKEIVECFQVWLVSKFDATLPSLEILKSILPKFVGENASASDIEVAEKITSAVLRVREVEQKDRSVLLSNRKKFFFLADDYWLSEAYLNRKMATKLGQKCSEDFILKLAEDLKKLVGQSGISWFPVESEGYEYLFTAERVDAGIVCELRKREKPIQEDLLYDLSKFSELLQKTDAFNPKSSKEFKEKVSAWLMGKNLSEAVLLAISEKLEKFYKNLWNDFSYSWYPSLQTVSMHSHRETEATFLQIFRDILDAKAKADPVMTRRIFSKLLNSSDYTFPIFTRLVLHCYSNEYTEYRQDFWNLVNNNKKFIFEKRDFEAEVFNLLQHNVNRLSNEERAILKGIIAEGPIATKDNELQKIYWRQRWYSALVEDQEFALLYKKCNEATKTKEFINFRDSHVRVGPGPSPLSKDDVLKITNLSLAQFIPEFEAKPRNLWDDPNPEALAGIIRQIAAESPEKFTRDLDPFRDTGYRYIYEMLWGFWDYLNKSKGAFEWEKTLNFIETYINRAEFWSDKFVAKGYSDFRDAKHDWIINVLVELIQIGVKDDGVNSIPARLNDKAENIINLVFNKIISQTSAEEDEKDPVFKSLNSNVGKLGTALLYLSLRIVRLQGDNPVGIRWKPELKTAYEMMLARNIIEPYTVLGEHFGNFLYLDKDWTEAKISEYLKLPNHLWEAFMSGFLYTSVVYDDYYKLMSAHYLKAIDFPFTNKNMQESLAQHIAIFYLRGLDDFNNEGLLDKLIKTNNPAQMNRLIGFLWMQRADAPQRGNSAVVAVYKDGEIKHEKIDLSNDVGRKQYDASIDKKIISLWGYLVQRYKVSEITTDEDKQNLADLVELSVFLPQLDKDSVEWIKTSVPYLKPWRSCTFLLDYLNRLKNNGDVKQNAEYIASILKAMTTYLLPEYKQEDIDDLLAFLFINNQTEAARNICQKYAEGHREEVVKKVFERYANNT